MIEEKIRRDVFEIVSLNKADDSDYWHNRSPLERIEAIEFMRKVMFGRDRVSERLQRILTVVGLKKVEYLVLRRGSCPCSKKGMGENGINSNKFGNCHIKKFVT